MNINPREIHGNWRKGWALDVHTPSSGLLPWEHSTERSQLGELLYEVKYRHDETKIPQIAEVAAGFVKEVSIDGHPIHCYLKAIIPIPPSEKGRDFQPVTKIAEIIGEILHVPAPSDYLIKVNETPLMKNTERTLKRQHLKDAYDIAPLRPNYKCVLLFDDIFDSGETLRAATQVLIKKGRIINEKNGKPRVFALTLTQTRKNE